MSLIDSTVVERFQRRVEALSAETRPRWGRMVPAEMLDHLSNSMEIGMGERVAAPLLPSWLAACVRPFGMLPLPIPHGLPSTDEFLARPSADLNDALARFSDTLRRFHRTVLGNPGLRHGHPAFGALSRLQWAELQRRHIDHHFKQFGL